MAKEKTTTLTFRIKEVTKKNIVWASMNLKPKLGSPGKIVQLLVEQYYGGKDRIDKLKSAIMADKNQLQAKLLDDIRSADLAPAERVEFIENLIDELNADLDSAREDVDNQEPELDEDGDGVEDDEVSFDDEETFEDEDRDLEDDE